MLNRKRHFGTVNPPMNGCFFYQDGKHFDADGRETDIHTGKLIEPVRAAPASPPPKPAPVKAEETEPEEPMMTREKELHAPSVVQTGPVDIDPLSRAGFELWANDPEAYKQLEGAPETWNDLKAGLKNAYGQDFPSKKLWTAFILNDIKNAQAGA